ncbi:phosphatidylglycerophosphatase A family protein [bacterium endosymbiont of Pedicinus badii]|uniref:phosphatidylglycerophosphatase A family protein n=1 Tax=bacterium endosymbiont of Pedicinus badii TaxID=1719126 RepID=UPI0009BC56C1|nr:phosphatidylglycerophosphatase A [bacterium endosymbiont of Pedicinus badii]OQM34289.1 hypothetical protein AOQ89_00095 [bacterium endosymbiont of Pedicinus badii]
MNILKIKKKNREKIKFRLHFMIATVFYIGLFPYMPGTLGTIFATIFWKTYLKNLNVFLYTIFLFSLIFYGIYCCKLVEKKTRIKDNRKIILDECIGIWTALLFCRNYDNKTIVFVFILFRFLDIYKPCIISFVEKNTKGGVSVVLDDITAGLLSAIIVYFINFFN